MHVIRTILAAAAICSLATPAAFAHHGWSSYDAAKELKITAPLKSVTWGNPHGSAKVNWNKADWDVVLAPVSRMEARGLTEAMINKGQTVTLIGYPRTDGTKEMRIERVIVGGKTVELR
jgi:hypothetical protein